ncbi:ATP-grasp domain-containing protein [Hyaloraphidium curvatum]|nr:ATP-grasp domain-containing protein [Hyaloraphidium curvatum]
MATIPKRMTSVILPSETKMSDKERRAALKGRRILFPGAGHLEKSFIIERAIELGCKVVVADLPDSYAKDMEGIELFIEADMLSHETAAKEVADKVKATGLEFDGIYNFWEDNVAMSSQIAELLGLRANPYNSARLARSKRETREAMRKAGLPTPVSILCKTTEDLEGALEKCPFPAVVKPVFGASAMGAVKCLTKDDARKAFAHNQKLLTVEYDAIYAQGADCLLEQYLDGEEVDVDIFLQDGKLMFWSITDNLPTLEPSFVNTGSNIPSVLSERKQQELVDLAVRTSTQALGMHIGVVHVEMKYTTQTGPQIVEVNGRLGGNPYPWWIKEVWGVDLVEQGLYACVGIPVEIKKAPKPKCALAMSFILSSKEGQITDADLDLFAQLENDPRIYEVMWEVPPDHKFHVQGEECLGYFTAKGKDIKEAIGIYLELTDRTRFPIPDYFWIAGAEHLPLRALEEPERIRRQSILQQAQSVRFGTDLARANNPLGLSESPLATSFKGGSYLSGSYKPASLSTSVGRPTVDSKAVLSTSPMAMGASPIQETPIGSLKRVGSLVRRESVGPKGLAAGGELFEMDGNEA